MADYRRSEIISGGFIVLSVLVFALFAFKVLGVPIWLLEESGVTCYAYLDEIKTLNDSSRVAIGGFKVGTVTNLEPAEIVFTDADIAAETQRTGSTPVKHKAGDVRHVIKATFRITTTSIRIGDGAYVWVAQEGFIGPCFLSLDPGIWTAAKPGKVVKDLAAKAPLFFPTERPQGLDDLMARAGPLLDKARDMLTRIDDDFLKPLLDPKNRDKVAEFIPLIDEALHSARDTLNSARDYLNPQRQDSLQTNLNRLLQDSDATVNSLRGKIETEVLPQVKDLLKQGQDTLASAQTAIKRIDDIIAKKTPEIEAIADNLKATSVSLKDGTADLKGRLDDLQGRLDKLLNDADALVTLKPADIAELVRSFRNSAWHFEMAMRKVKANPSLLIFGDDEKDLEAVPRDETGLRRSGRASPYEQRDESEKKKD